MQPALRRLTLFFAGYEPLEAAVHHRRYQREVKRFDATWGATTLVSPLVMADDGSHGVWQVEMEGPNWRSQSDIHLMRWDDVIDLDNRRALPERLVLYLRAFLRFMLNGTMLRYGRAHWRYLCFTLYPVAMLLFFAALACAVAAFVPAPVWLKMGLGLSAFALLLHGLGRRWHLDYMFNDWAFADDLVHQTRPLMQARLDAFAQHIIMAAEEGTYDEIVLVGHSLGAALMVEAMARALRRKPDLVAKAPPLALVGVGSSLLKIALHPHAQWLRSSVVSLTQEAKLPWVDYDSHLDWICFYKADLGQWMDHALAHPPERRAIRLSRMLRPETWARFKLNFLRLHRQYVMGNEMRYPYDFHMLTAGPLPVRTIIAKDAAWPARFDETGRLS